MIRPLKKYKIRIDTILDEDGSPHTVYGIETMNQVLSISDVFTDYRAASRFVALCNDLDLSTIHLRDVIDDLL